jgi:hypothetical protein
MYYKGPHENRSAQWDWTFHSADVFGKFVNLIIGQDSRLVGPR